MDDNSSSRWCKWFTVVVELAVMETVAGDLRIGTGRVKEIESYRRGRESNKWKNGGIRNINNPHSRIEIMVTFKDDFILFIVSVSIKT